MKTARWLTIGGTILLVAGCADGLVPTASEMKPSAPNFGSFGSPNASFTSINEAEDGGNFCLNGPGVVNCNIYTEKQYVWLNAGPTGTVNGLGEGTYFFAVLSPSGQNAEVNDGATVGVGDAGTPHNLSDDFDAYTNRTFTINGDGTVSYGGGHDVTGNNTTDAKIRLVDYSNTLNNGGVYILAICGYPVPVDPQTCKYDAFKVRSEGGGGGGGGGDPLASGLKYYDTNTNGQWDAGEPGIPGWQIDYTDGVTPGVITTVASPAGTFDITLVAGATYTFTEKQGLPFTSGVTSGYWVQTGNTVDQSLDFLNTTTLATKIYTVLTVADGVTTGLNFGNVCYLNPGGRTLGFWSNRNGLGLLTTADFTALNLLNLRIANGDEKNFNQTLSQNKTALNTWLLGANATNMAYMLSVQLAATKLDVLHGFTDASVITIDEMTVTQLMDYANALLANPISGGTFDGLNGSLTVAASALRTEQERVKNALDMINNNGGLGGFLQAPGVCPAPTFAP
jgi:hypothetical protein